MVRRLIAQVTGEEGIVNPVLGNNLGMGSDPASSGSNLALYIAFLWQTAMMVGGLAVIVSLLLGGVEWVMSNGDKGKVEHARERIMQTVIGMIVLMTAAGVTVFLSNAFRINLLNPQFINNLTN